MDRDIFALKQKLETIQNSILAGICCLLFTVFVIFSIPVYVFRKIVIFFAKWVRPDLGEIVTPTSALWVNDLFSGNPPRCTLVIPMTYQGHWTHAKFRQIIQDRWVNAVDKVSGERVYERLRQYPHRWLGFTFWKHSGKSFNLEDHVHYHDTTNGEVNTTENFNELVEKLLNATYPSGVSPWEVHYLANYRNTQDKEYSSPKPMFALILKVHHSLGDGFSFMSAVTEGLCGESLENLVPLPRPAKLTMKEKILKNVSIISRIFVEMPYELRKMFEECPWRVDDKIKTWKQFYGRSNLIPIQNIKDIKNSFGVSFASVLLSAMSFGIHKDLNGREGCTDRSTMSGWSALPLPRKDKSLTNCFTGTLFDIPTVSFPDPVSRLKTCHKILRRAHFSSIPHAVRMHQIAVGSHFYPVCKLFSENPVVSTGLSNFPGIPTTIGIDDAVGISSDFAVGGMEGHAGVGVSVHRYGDYIRIAVTAEKAVMTRQQVDAFLRNMQQEIRELYALVTVTTGSNSGLL